MDESSINTAIASRRDAGVQEFPSFLQERRGEVLPALSPSRRYLFMTTSKKETFWMNGQVLIELLEKMDGC